MTVRIHRREPTKSSSVGWAARSRPQAAHPLPAKPLLDQAILEQLPQAVLITRASDHRVVLANPAAYSLFDVDRLERACAHELQRQLLDQDGRPVAPDDHPLVRAAARRTDLRQVPFQMVRHDDRVIELLISAVPLYSRASYVVGVLGLFEDVTRLRQLERMKEDLLAVASHEIRGALTSLKGWGQYAEQKLRDQASASVLRPVVEMNAQILRFESLADRLLDLSQLDFEGSRPTQSVMDLRDAVQAAVDSLPLPLRSRVSVRRQGRVAVRADRQRLESVLRNLLTNALKYSDAPVAVRLLDVNGWVLALVLDRGIGIPRAALPHIFERFYRAPNSTSASGSGLGLYICRSIVEQHGGAMCVRTREGRGSIIGFRLPHVP